VDWEIIWLAMGTGWHGTRVQYEPWKEIYPMERVTVVYPNKADATFNFDYYTKKHVPWVAKLVGKNIEVRRGISLATGSPAAFVCLATIPINSVAEFQAMFAEHGAAILADVPNYTNIEPIVQFDEILA
jgi:uncharacterized protein (TIGR02118 family)